MRGRGRRGGRASRVEWIVIPTRGYRLEQRFVLLATPYQANLIPRTLGILQCHRSWLCRARGFGYVNGLVATEPGSREGR
jgi:hypothetical protein